jgi:hypothetical protein
MTKTDVIDVQTLSGTTGTAVSKIINGKILSIKIYAEAEIAITAITSGCPIPEYIFGASGAAITVSAGNHIYYPRVEGHLASTGVALAAANKTNVFQQLAISGTVTYAVTGTDTKDWQVVIVYED